MKYNLAMALTLTLTLAACNSTLNTVTESITNNAGKLWQGTNNGVANADSSLQIHPALAAQDPLLAAYGTSTIFLFSAQEIWLDAMGDAQGAAQLNAERTALENGAVIDSDAIERHKKISEHTSGLIENAAGKEENLSNEGRKKFLTGWVPYIAGLALTSQVVKRGQQYSQDVASSWTVANVVENGKKTLVLGMLLKTAPSYLETHYNSGKLIIDYSKDQGLEVPQAANDVMKGIEL